MKTNFIKYDGSQESVDDIQALVDRANIKYKGIYLYEMIKSKFNNGIRSVDVIGINSKNLNDEEDESISIGTEIGGYVYFNIPENKHNYSSVFPSFKSCNENYYLEYKNSIEL
jgi:hypothetical protein